MATDKGKKQKGQFYTVNSAYILDGLYAPSSAAKRIVEPFAGKGDLLDWLATKGNTLPVKAYDIDPKKDLIPVCANCHAMLHRQTPALKPDELRMLLKDTRD
jgi:hypothetical protein